MATNGDTNPAQNAAQDSAGPSALPKTQGPANVLGPVSGTPVTKANTVVGGSGDSPKAPMPSGKAPMPTAGSWPQRLRQAQEAEAGTPTLLTPPYEPDKKETEELDKSELIALGPAGAIAKIAAIGAKDSAVAAATSMYPDDPKAAALATTEALTTVLSTTLAAREESSGFGGRDTTSPTPNRFQSKHAQDIVLAGIISSRSDGDKWNSDKNSLFKNAKLMPPFPGSAMRTQPDLWEEWWERIYALKEVLQCET